MKYFLLIALILSVTTSVFAARPDEMLADPALEARAREISRDLRCPVCQNQSIDDSDAELSHDLRVLVRHRLTKGDSDAEVKRYIVDRYGEYVLLTPPFGKTTFVLWLAPLFLLGCGFFAARAFFRVREKTSLALTEAEQKRLALLLQDKNPGGGT